MSLLSNFIRLLNLFILKNYKLLYRWSVLFIGSVDIVHSRPWVQVSRAILIFSGQASVFIKINQFVCSINNSRRFILKNEKIHKKNSTSRNWQPFLIFPDWDYNSQEPGILWHPWDWWAESGSCIQQSRLWFSDLNQMNTEAIRSRIFSLESWEHW